MSADAAAGQKTCAKCGGRIEAGKRTCIFGHIQIGGGSKPAPTGGAKPAQGGQASAPASPQTTAEPAPAVRAAGTESPRPAAPAQAPSASVMPTSEVVVKPPLAHVSDPGGRTESSAPSGSTGEALSREKRLLMEKAGEIRNQKEELEKARTAYEGEIQVMHARAHDLEEREARLGRETDDARALKENLDTKLKVEEERIRSREQSAREQEQALARSVVRFEERQSEIVERERMLKAQADRVRADVDLVERDRDRVKEEVEKVRSLWDIFQNAIADVKRKAEQLAQLESEVGRTRADFVSLEARLKEKEVEVAELKLKLHMAQGQVERAGSRHGGDAAKVDAPGVVLQLPTPEPGQSYLLVTDDSGPLYSTYAGLLDSGSDGVMVVSTHPDKLRKKFGITRGRALWLTTDRGSGSVHPARLDYELTRDLTKFFKEKPGGVILLDGIRTLVQASGFDKVATFIKRLCDLAATQNGIVMVPVQPESFEAQEMTVLKEGFDLVVEPPVAPGR